MSDLISRQAAIDEVEFGITYAKAFDAETGEVRELFKASNEELQKAVERIKALPSAEPKWIPVTERLPDKGGDYLVSKTFHYGKLTQRFIMVAVYALNLREVDRYTFREDRPGWYDIDSEYGAYEVDNITAWLPLPDPYREEEE